MSSSFTFMSGDDLLQDLHSGTITAVVLEALGPGFKGLLASPLEIYGKDLIPDYGLADLQLPFDVDIKQSSAFEVSGASLHGTNFVEFEGKRIVSSRFIGNNVPNPDLGEGGSFSIGEPHSGWEGDDDARIPALSGRYALVFWDAAYMYHHWLFECLPRAIALYQDPRLTDVKLLIPHGAPGFVESSLAFVGIDQSRIEYYNPQGTTFVDRLIVLPVPTFERDRCLAGYLELLRTAVLEQLAKKPVTPTPAKIIFTRRDALMGERLLLNENDVILAAESVGYTAIELGNCSFEEQVRLASQATHIACIHGSAGANLLFASEGARIVHLFPDCVHYFLTHGIGTAVAKAEYLYVFGLSFERGLRYHNNPWLLGVEKVLQAI